MDIQIEHSESSRLWRKIHIPGHSIQVFARFAVIMCLRRRHPDVVGRHMRLINRIIRRLEKKARHESTSA